jgi:hypothetical protein
MGENGLEVLDFLYRCDGRITDYGHPAGQVLINPATGAGERIEPETFSLLLDAGWIDTEDQGRIRRYRISAAGVARLQPPRIRASGAG